MNWKLIFQLSLFGLAMAVATVFWVPSNVEPFLWLVIFVICAYLIAARAGGNPFGHGVLVGLANSVWVTSAHVLLFNQYIASHAKELEMMRTMPMAWSPRLLMTVTGPIIGIVSGIVLGIFALIASRIVRRRTAAASAA